MKEQFIKLNELQAKIAPVTREVETKNSRFVVLRYSKPVGVYLSYSDYQKIISRSDCKECMSSLVDLKKKLEDHKL